MSNLNELGRLLAFVLRHRPDFIGIILDEHGWADVNELIEGINKQKYIDMTILEEVVANDNKGRYSFNEDMTKIRANQGHSINVDVELKEAIPPEILFHGTAEKYVSSIEKTGLLPKSRLYVHLSKDIDTAIEVGKRHGTPVIYEIDTAQMSNDGIKFYLSSNGVWLVKNVEVKYLKRINV